MRGTLRGAGSGRDLFADERVEAERPRGLRKLFFWNRLSGRVGMVALAAFVFGGLGWAVFQGVGRGPEGMEVGFLAVPEAGRELNGVEYALAEQYGEPLYLGPGGLPVIRVGGTGDVREMTPVEARFNSSRLFEPAGYGRVLWGPGPRGWGLWWNDHFEGSEIRPDVGFGRNDWAGKQEDELLYVTGLVSRGVQLVAGFNFDLWEKGRGRVLLEVVGGMSEPYTVVSDGGWAAVPLQWVCSGEIDAGLNLGVSPGCVSAEYVSALVAVWEQVGRVEMFLGRTARLAVHMDGLAADELYQGEFLLGQVYLGLDLKEEVDRLAGLLDELYLVSRDEGLVIDVKLFREPP